MSIRPAWLWLKRRQRTMRNIWLLRKAGEAPAFLSVLPTWYLGVLSLHWSLQPPEALSNLRTLSVPSPLGAFNLPITDWGCFALFSLSAFVETCWAPGAPWGAMATVSSDARQATVLCVRMICRNRFAKNINSQWHVKGLALTGWHKRCYWNWWDQFKFKCCGFWMDTLILKQGVEGRSFNSLIKEITEIFCHPGSSYFSATSLIRFQMSLVIQFWQADGFDVNKLAKLSKIHF